MASSSPEATPAGAVVTVRGLAPELKARLRVRAAHNARSMEAEARAILEVALSAPEEDRTDLAAFARSLFAPLGGVELDLPPREHVREPPNLGAPTPAQAQPAEEEPALPGSEPGDGTSRAGPAKVARRKSEPRGGRPR